MYWLMSVSLNPSYQDYLQWSLIVIILGGFLVATIIGSIAWYNSRKPVGWENTPTPKWVRFFNNKTSDSNNK